MQLSGVQILNCFKLQGYYEMQFLPASMEKGENICFDNFLSLEISQLFLN